MKPTPLSAVEQYAYTNGGCYLFLRAARRVVGGVPTALMATDPRQKLEHDWPIDEPLELHVFLMMDDGRVVDGEGIRPLDDLLSGFGVREGFSFDLEDKLPAARLGKEDAVMEGRIEQRLRDLGWGQGLAAECDNALGDRAVYRRAGKEVEAWWPKWEAHGELPGQDMKPAARNARKLR